jgi:hypothetical protein
MKPDQARRFGHDLARSAWAESAVLIRVVQDSLRNYRTPACGTPPREHALRQLPS